jgi:hypothetical protein
MKWTVTTAGALKEHLQDIPADDWRTGQPLVASALIEWNGERGVTYLRPGNLVT